VLAETPAVIAGHAFTTGQIKRRTIERVTGGARVEYAMRDGLGCNASHFAPADQLGKIVDDQHYHEHATCFNVKDRGLVVLSSCGHRQDGSHRPAPEPSVCRTLPALAWRN
jgi:7,8-dihydropterin-6-yl-methyl-4-(beta-D-ribofuranosyl)aminobenzene 5'-phosphate synthase